MVRFNTGWMLGVVAAAVVTLAGPAMADFAVTANDSHSVNVDGVHGGYGYVTDFRVERIYRDVRVRQIHEGTSDFHAAGHRP